MASIYDIVYYYMDLFFKGTKLTKEQKKTIHREVKKLLSNGWCSSELYAHLKAAKRKNPNKQTLYVSSFFGGTRKERLNLMDPDTFYYHNELRLTSAAPKRQIDYDSGEILVINEPYFLEMKASYTIEDLIQYFARQTRIKILEHEMQRYVGSVKWMLKTYGLEDILFMIDATVNMSMAEDLPMPESVLDVQRYKGEGRDARNLKVTETIQSGGKKIVRKKRTRTN
jgi:hypothetical protein